MVEFDLAPPELTDGDIARVESILESDEVYQGFTLVVGQDGADQRYNASDRDFPPPLSEIQEHFAARLRRDAALRFELSESDSTLVDEEADLRLYRVTHESWADDVEPRSIIVSMRDENVLG